MSNMDEALLKAFPLLAASASGQQQPAADFGTRYLVGRYGVSREVTLPWIRACQLIAPSALTLPYGVVPDAVEFRCGPIPGAVVREFVADAKSAYPLEIAGVFLWNEADDSWRYARGDDGERLAHRVRGSARRRR
jgi:PRTRC genetic system protein A